MVWFAEGRRCRKISAYDNLRRPGVKLSQLAASRREMAGWVVTAENVDVAEESAGKEPSEGEIACISAVSGCSCCLRSAVALEWLLHKSF